MEQTQTAEKKAALFGNNPDISLDERARVIAELNKIGSLTFDFSSDAEGWIAQCQEVPGIIAGGENAKPSNDEVESTIRSAIYAAFDVQTTPPEKRSSYFTVRDFTTAKLSTAKE